MPRAYISALICILLGIAAIACFTILAIDLVKLYNRGKLKRNAATQTMFFCMVEAAVLTVYQSMYVATIFDHANADKLDANNLGQKYGSLENPSRFTFGVILLATVTSTLNVSLFWIDIVSKSAKLSQKHQTTMAKYGKFVVLLQLTVVLITVPLLILSQYFFLSLAMAPFMGFIVVTYAYGSTKMMEILKQAGSIGSTLSSPRMSSKDGGVSRAEKAQRAIVLIRQTAILVCVWVAYAFFAAVIYSILSLTELKSYMNPDFIMGWPVFSNQQIFVGITMLLATIVRYAHLSVSRAHLSGGADTSVTSGNGTTDSRSNRQAVVPTMDSVVATGVDDD